jgi:hypothetical protein
MLNKSSSVFIASALSLAAASFAASPVSAQTEADAIAPQPATRSVKAISSIVARVTPNRVNPSPATTALGIDDRLLNAANRLTSASPSLLPTPSAQAETPLASQSQPPQTNTSSEVLVAYQGNQPVPGSLETSVSALFTPADFGLEPTQVEIEDTAIAQATLAQERRTALNRLTTESYSYIGLGGNIGISDNNRETSLGRGSFVINGKVGLTPNASVRPAVIINDDATFLLPITYDFRIPTNDPLVLSPFIPFAGAGLVLSTQDNNHIGFLLSGGVDYRIAPNWTANGSVNLGFLDEVDIGIILGVGYTFPGFNF